MQSCDSCSMHDAELGLTTPHSKTLSNSIPLHKAQQALVPDHRQDTLLSLELHEMIHQPINLHKHTDNHNDTKNACQPWLGACGASLSSPGRFVLSDLIGAGNRQMMAVRQDHTSIRCINHTFTQHLQALQHLKWQPSA